jgi:hypothetical protein
MYKSLIKNYIYTYIYLRKYSINMHKDSRDFLLLLSFELIIISFTLSVDDFGVKYTNTEYFDFLTATTPYNRTRRSQ